MKNRNNIQIFLIIFLSFLFTLISQAAPSTPSEIINESIDVLKEMSYAKDSEAFGLC